MLIRRVLLWCSGLVIIAAGFFLFQKLSEPTVAEILQAEQEIYTVLLAEQKSAYSDVPDKIQLVEFTNSGEFQLDVPQGGAGILQGGLELKNLSSLERKTWLDFQKKNTTSYPVKNYLPDSADVILINPANGKQLYWWVSFSRIGFNPSMTQALVLEVIQVRHGALLHDMGKLGVPDHVLHKPDKLTDEEWMIMKKHPQFAYDMLYQIEHLRPALDIPLCHHEKWDGSGYPRGLKEKEIPLPARLFAIVDMWDALTSDRPYRAAWTREAALAHIQEQSGKHFDPEVVELFLKFVAEG